MSTTSFLRRLACCSSAVILAVHAIAAQPPAATLALDPPRTLPGLPVAFNVIITNMGDDPITFGDLMVLEVTTANEKFLAKGIENRTNLNLPDEVVGPCGAGKCFTVPPHSERQLYINYGPALVQNEFFADPPVSERTAGLRDSDGPGHADRFHSHRR
jgi:hypothetical protein